MPQLTDRQIKVLAALRMGVKAAVDSMPEEQRDNLHVTNKACDVQELINIIDALQGN